MNENNINNQNQIHQILDGIKKKLLDLSGRNTLLNFRHRKTNSLRIIDELPNQLFEKLVNDKKFTLKAIPEPKENELEENGFIEFNFDLKKYEEIKKRPTANEWSQYLKINNSFDLPEDTSYTKEKKHTDLLIQTLLYPYELETFLRKFKSKAKTHIEETGSNILYLAFGFIEWFENYNCDKSKNAPLLLLPVFASIKL